MKKNRCTVRLCLICPLFIIGIVSAGLFGCSEKPEQATVSRESVSEEKTAAEPPKAVESVPEETKVTESVPAQMEVAESAPDQMGVVESAPDQSLSDGGEEEVNISSEQAASTTREDPALPDVISMDNKAYAEHTKAVVLFTHQKHMDEYAKKFPEFYKDGCGACHHDADNQPLVLETGDAVQGCIECHKIPGERPKGKDAPELSKEERLAYHAEAMHYNCKGCHSDVNEKTGTKDAPTTCTKCHLKET